MFKNFKRQLSFVLVFVMVFGLVFTGLSEISFAARPRKITVVHVNDVHGRVKEDDYEKAIGFAKLKTKIEELRKENENLLVLNGGDTIHGNTIVNLSEGRTMIELMNLVGFDAMVPGNHDFNYGYDRLLELKKLAKFPIISANIRNEKGNSDYEAFVIKEVDGVKLGIFGLTTDESKFKTHPNNIEGIEFLDPIESAKKTVLDMKKAGADLIICLGHIGIDGTSLATSEEIMERVDGIDLFVDGHSHEELNKEFKDNRLLVQAGDYTRNIGLVEIEVEENKVSKIEGSLIDYEKVKDLKPNKQILDYIEKIEKENEPILNEVVGEALVDLDGKRENVRTKESNLGNLLTDVMVKYTEGDIAFLNGGDIRADIDKGEVTVGDIITTVPFSSMLQVIEVSGEDLLQALERGVDTYPEAAGHFPQVSGIEYSFDPQKPVGNRILSVKVEGKALDKNAKYKMVTNDFITAGGDGYTMLKDKKLISDVGLLESDLLIRYFKEVKEVSPRVEGRIKVGIKQIEDLETLGLKVTFNGKLLKFTEDLGRPFIDENNRTLIPVRAISEALGHKVKWNSEDRIVSIDDNVSLTIGKKFVMVDGKKLEVDSAARIKNDRTYVPIRFVSEALGYDVQWEGSTRTVIIKDKLKDKPAA